MGCGSATSSRRRRPIPEGNTSEFSMASESVPPISRFLNVSTRLRVQTGENVLIGGFIITGTEPTEVFVRAIGPSLGDSWGARIFWPIPFSNCISPMAPWSPMITGVTRRRRRSSPPVFRLTTIRNPPSSLHLEPGAYTAIVSGVNGGNRDRVGRGLRSERDGCRAELANVSTRGLVETERQRHDWWA